MSIHSGYMGDENAYQSTYLTTYYCLAVTLTLGHQKPDQFIFCPTASKWWNSHKRFMFTDAQTAQKQNAFVSFWWWRRRTNILSRTIWLTFYVSSNYFSLWDPLPHLVLPFPVPPLGDKIPD